MWKRLPPLAPISSPNMAFPREPLEVRNQWEFNFFSFAPSAVFPPQSLDQQLLSMANTLRQEYYPWEVPTFPPGKHSNNFLGNFPFYKMIKFRTGCYLSYFKILHG